VGRGDITGKQMAGVHEDAIDPEKGYEKINFVEGIHE